MNRTYEVTLSTSVQGGTKNIMAHILTPKPMLIILILALLLSFFLLFIGCLSLLFHFAQTG